jgi:hypothetical protein
MAKTQTKSNSKEFPFSYPHIFTPSHPHFLTHLSLLTSPQLNFSREVLYHRHRLSHQQIDQLLGEQKSGQYLPEKLAQMEQLGEFLKITGQLNKQGIQFIILKGPLLSQRIYGDPTFRYYKDFDILLQPRSMKETIGFFLSLSFYPDYFAWPNSKLKERLVFRHLNQYPLSHSPTGINIELHWRLFSNYIVADKTLNKLMEKNQEDVSMAGQTFRQFNNEFGLLYLVIHGGLHAWRRLKWLVDVHEMLNRFPLDEAKFLDLTRKLKAGRMVALCNAMLKEYFPGTKQMPCAKKVNKFHLRHSRHYILREQDQPGASLYDTWQRARFKLTAFPGLRYKLSAFRFSTFTQREVNENWFPPYPLLVIIDRLWRKTKP